MAAEHKSAMLAFQSGFKFDAVDLIFSAGGSVVAMMILHQVHVQVFVESREPWAKIDHTRNFARAGQRM